MQNKWNYTLCVDYLRGKTSHIYLPESNQDIKNLRYQLIGGSYPASFGFYAFDLYILEIAVGMPR